MSPCECDVTKSKTTESEGRFQIVNDWQGQIRVKEWLLKGSNYRIILDTDESVPSLNIEMTPSINTLKANKLWDCKCEHFKLSTNNITSKTVITIQTICYICVTMTLQNFLLNAMNASQ